MPDWFDGAGNGAQLDAVEVLTDTHVNRGLAEIAEGGALVSFGKTSDGGALSVTVTVDGRWRREYFRTSDELLQWIAEAIPAVQDARRSSDASGGSRQRPRRSRGL